MNSIILNNIRIFSNHGCMDEEKKIGSEYRVDIIIEYDLIPAAISDELKDTLDYVFLNNIIIKQMKIRSNLLENIAYRIIKEIRKNSPKTKTIHLSIAKINPPIRGNVEYVAIKMEDNNF